MLYSRNGIPFLRIILRMGGLWYPGRQAACWSKDAGTFLRKGFHAKAARELLRNMQQRATPRNTQRTATSPILYSLYMLCPPITRSYPAYHDVLSWAWTQSCAVVLIRPPHTSQSLIPFIPPHIAPTSDMLGSPEYPFYFLLPFQARAVFWFFYAPYVGWTDPHTERDK